MGTNLTWLSNRENLAKLNTKVSFYCHNVCKMLLKCNGTLETIVIPEQTTVMA